MGAWIIGILRWLGPVVLRAWVNVLMSDLGKFYSENKDLFLNAVREAEEAITATDVPDPWERREAKIKYVWKIVAPALAELGTGISSRLIYGAIEAAVAEVKGGGK
jgi:hypothetical protein